MGSRGRNVSTCSDNHNQRSYSGYTEVLSESDESGDGHWKSRSKKKKSSREEDDLSTMIYDDLKKAFLKNYLQTEKCIKDPEEHSITTSIGMENSLKRFVRRGEVAAPNHEQEKSFLPWKQQEGNQKQKFKKGGFRN
ncbi:hypothetical protein Tco_0963523 [Tanacetum coccineum]